MSNNPVDTGQTSAQQLEQEEVDNQTATQISFRVRVDSLTFHKRMAQYFFECHLIPEPKLSLLAKACLNVMAHKYAKLEEDALARYVQKNLAEARGPQYVSVPQIQREVGVRNPVAKTTKDLIPSRLRRDPPLDPIQEPEWAQGW